jgi:hypothetical protein
MFNHREASCPGTKIPLDPPFSKGEFPEYCFNPSLEKRGRGDFWPERFNNYSTNSRYATLEKP